MTHTPLRKPTALILIAALLLGLLTAAVSACATSTQPTQPPRPTSSGRWVTIDGYDGDLLIEPINLFNDYENRAAGLAAQVKHGDRVRLITRSGEGVQVETTSGKRGWCNYLFIKELKTPPTSRPRATSTPKPIQEYATSQPPQPDVLATATTSPTPAPTPLPIVIVNADVVNVRAGPGTDHERVGQVVKGTRLEVVGQNEGGDWLHVCCLENQNVWIAGWLVEQGHDSGGLLVNTPTPRPTPIPTQNATATKRPTARPTLKPVAPAAPRICCKICRKGKACGDSCIARDKTCHKPPGCACNG